jgi:hypothetical protein
MNIFNTKDHIIEAIYDDGVAPIHRGNPFVEALPRYETPAKIIEKLRRKPDYKPEYRMLSDDQRLDMLPEIEKVYQPISRDITLFSRMYAQMKACYAGRLRADPRYFQKALQWQGKKYPSFMADRPEGYKPKSLLISAIGGAGKTTATVRWLSLIPQAIRHNSYQGTPFYVTQVPYIRLDCHIDGEPRSLCERMIHTLDSILDTRYADRYINKSRRSTVSELMDDVSTLFHLHGVVLIVIDHMESMSAVKSGGAGYLSNFIYELSSQVGATVVFIGTPDIARFVTKTFRQLRRSAELGSVPWLLSEEDRDKILERIWWYQLTRDKTKLTSDIKKAFTTHTLRIPSLDAALYHLVQERAITSRSIRGDESITADLVDSVAHDSFYMLEEVKYILTGARQEGWHRFPDLPRVKPKDSHDDSSVQDKKNYANAPSEPAKSKSSVRSKSNDSLIEEKNKGALKETSVHDVLMEQGIIPDIEELLS